MSFSTFLPFVGTLAQTAGQMFGQAKSAKLQKKYYRLSKQQFRYQQNLNKQGHADYINNVRYARMQDRREDYDDAHRIEMLTDDAKRAGIHPLAAIGAGGGSGPVGMPVGPSFGAGGGMGGGDFASGDMIGAGLEGLGEALNSLYAADQDLLQFDADSKARADAARAGRQALDDARHDAVQNRIAQMGAEQRLQKKDMLDSEYTKALIENVRADTLSKTARSMMQGGPGSNGLQPRELAIGPYKLPLKGPSAQTVQNELGDFAEQIYGMARLAAGLVSSFGRQKGAPTPPNRSGYKGR